MVTLIPSDVGTDAAALAPPLVTVSRQTVQQNKQIHDKWCPFDFVSFILDQGNVSSLPGLDVLRHDAPCQVIVAVVTAWVVKEISPRGEDMTGKPRATLHGQDGHKQENKCNMSSVFTGKT